MTQKRENMANNKEKLSEHNTNPKKRHFFDFIKGLFQKKNNKETEEVIEEDTKWEFTDRTPIEYTLFDGKYTVKIDGFFKPIYEEYFTTLSEEYLENRFMLWKHYGKQYKTSDDIELCLNSHIAYDIQSYEEAHPNSSKVRKMHKIYTYQFVED